MTQGNEREDNKRMNSTTFLQTKPRRTYLGIDPGHSGGMVAITPNSIISTPLSAFNHHDIRNWIENIVRLSAGMSNVF